MPAAIASEVILRRFIWLLSLLAVLAAGGLAAAQSLSAITGETTEEASPIVLPDPLTPEAINALVSRLSDEQVRQLLLERLDAVASESGSAEAAEATPMTQMLSDWLAAITFSGQTAFEKVPALIKEFADTFKAFTESRGEGGVMSYFLTLLCGIGAGLLGWYAVIRSPLRRLVRRPDENTPLGQTVRLLAMRFGVDVLAIAVFVLVSSSVHGFVLGARDFQSTHLVMTNLVMLPLIVSAVSRFMLSPGWPEARLVHTDNWTARYLHRNSIGLAFASGMAFFLIQFSRMQDTDLMDDWFGFWINLVIFVWFGTVTVRARRGISQMMIGRAGDATPTEVWVANAFPWFFIGVLIATWFLIPYVGSSNTGLELLVGGAHIHTLLLISMAPAADTLVRGLVRHLVPPMRGEGLLAERAYYSTKRSYIRIGRVIAFATIISLIADHWQISFTGLASESFGEQFAARGFEVVFIIAIGYLIWELATLWFNRKLAAEQTASGFDLTADEPGGGEGGGQGGSRLSTVLPVIRIVVQTTIGIMTLLFALRHMGIDITPLLAGAGIVGIAIGFGAQTLVRDIVSGLFFLIDDAFRVGEYLVIEGTVGTVERLNIRSLQLRHHTGPVHTIPYGEIPKVTNNSRDWVIMKMKFTFPFETDPNRIKKIFKKIGQEVLQADYADNLIQTFKSQGVYDVDDVGIVIRGKFMAKPGSQWIIRKDIYNRVQKALDEAGIQFARREVRVQIPGLEEPQQLTGPQIEAVAAAANEAVQQGLPAPGEKK
ncbi:mechanosensitive ion channel domain-containing protein [Oricola sp.]|uniref:mechanosensitive ion channel domain-containing protein n=1 Tax=Oricola sp. TaxID=1979950 RepID=UPI003BAD43BD